MVGRVTGTTHIFIYLFIYLFLTKSLYERDASLTALTNVESSLRVSVEWEQTPFATYPVFSLIGTCFFLLLPYLVFLSFRLTSASYSSLYFLTSSTRDNFSSFEYLCFPFLLNFRFIPI